MIHPQSRLILGFHGCDETVGEKLLDGRETFRPTYEPWHWLGQGIYFWEGDPDRALDWCAYISDFQKKTGRPTTIHQPFVIGAVIELGRCLDLTNHFSLEMLKKAYESLEAGHKKAATAMPENKFGPDRAMRALDCAVIDHLYMLLEMQAPAAPFDTARGFFLEGPALYPNAGFKERTHIEICVRNLDKVVGLFRVGNHRLKRPFSKF